MASSRMSYVAHETDPMSRPLEQTSTPDVERPPSARREVLMASGAALVASAGLWAASVQLGPVAVAVGLLGAVSAAVVDLRTKRLPNRILFPVVAAALVLLLASAVLEEPSRALVAIGVGAGGLVVFGLIWFTRPAALGYGDVKLAGLLGLVVGWYGPIAALLAVVAAFLSAAVIAVVLLTLGRSRETEMAFGPFMTLGAIVAVTLAEFGVLAV